MRTTSAILVFVASWVCSAIAMAFVTPMSPMVAVVSLVVAALIAGVVYAITPATHGPRCTPGDIVMFTIFALASLRAFLWLIYPVGDEWRILSPNNLGDISLHLQFIRYLAAGVDFWPSSPILAGVPMSYPIGMDLLNSLLLLLGLPVERGLIIIGLLGAALSAWALWRWGGGFAIAALVFNGGLAGFAIFHTLHFEDYQSTLAWKNFFLAMFVTQRGLLYALPCTLLLLTAWREDFFRSGSSIPRAVQIGLYATLPFFHAHAFVFLSVVLVALFLGRPVHRRELVTIGLCALIPASVAMGLITGGFSAGSSVRWMPGWMQADGGWIFWALNFGIALPLLGILFWRCLRQPDAELRVFAGAGLVIFVLCLFVAFAPWEWDNTKFMLWAWLACAPYLWKHVIRPWPKAVRVGVCGLLFFSGAVSLVGGLDGRHGYRLASRSELAEAAHLLRDVPPQDRIAIAPDYNHPVILLGHPVLCGYEGHLSSHALNYKTQWAALQDILEQQPGWQQRAATSRADWFFIRGDPPTLLPLENSIPSAR